MKKLGLLALFTLTFVFVQAQGGSAFGVKGGLTLGTQKWNNLDQGPLFSWHGDVYIESLAPNNAFALIAQLGYHNRGSARRNQRIFTQNSNFLTINQNFEFYNISLMVGAKQKFDFQSSSKIYYLFGLRGEYTLGDNLDDYQTFNTGGFYPFPSGVRKLNMGLTVGGGFEVMLSKLFGGFLEFSIAPDITAQYKQQQINGVRNPYTGNSQTIGERTIRNLSFEVSLGIRLLRIVEYVD